jgi:hypothetical protein
MTPPSPPPDAPVPLAAGRDAAPWVLAALLDRSLVRMSESAEDVLRYDRRAIHEAANVWDNNVFPLFRVACTAGAYRRAGRARAALAWMADLGEERYRWMAEQAAAAGYGAGELPPAPGPSAPGRDHAGRVMPPVCRIGRPAVDALLADYGLDSASVRGLRVERAGTRLTASLRLAVTRRYPVGEDPPKAPALLGVSLRDVTEAVFRLSGTGTGTGGAELHAGPDGVVISLGPAGRLRAAGGDLWLDDRTWHRSAAGRRADAVTPPRTGRREGVPPPAAGRLGPDARTAAALLRYGMWELRSVRDPGSADRVPVLALCRAFAGAGTAVLDAGSRYGGRRREAAFRELIRTWAVRGGPELAPWFRSVLAAEKGAADLVAETAGVPRGAGTEPCAGTGPAASPGGVPGPVPAALVMADWTAGHERFGERRPATALLMLALPPRAGDPSSAPWRLRTAEGTEPDVLDLRTEAFAGPGLLARAGEPAPGSGLDLHNGALRGTAPGGWRVVKG